MGCAVAATERAHPEPSARAPRDHSVDVLKGIGIVVVAMGHIDYTGIGGSFIVYLYTFNVALFFVIAGYTWRAKPGVPMWAIIAQKFRQIYIPYVVLFAISLFYGHVIVRYVFGQYVIPFEWRPTIKALLFSSEWLNTVPTFNFALWFLPIFLISSVAFQFVQLLRSRTWLYVSVAVLLLIGSLPFQMLLPGRPVLNINVLPVALVLMCAGYLLKKHVRLDGLSAWIYAGLIAVSLAVAFTIPGNISNIRSYLYFPSAIASFVVYLALARFSVASRFLLYVGRDSLILFGIQGLVANTYTYTGIPQFLGTGWDGLMLYLANLAYVMIVSVAAVFAYRWVRGLIARRWAGRRQVPTEDMSPTRPTDSLKA